MVAGGRELIDTLWNVNESLLLSPLLFLSELIDTLWNVNEQGYSFLPPLPLELIDTLWNVNKVEILELITKELGN